MRKLFLLTLGGILLGVMVVYGDLLNASFENATNTWDGGQASDPLYWTWDQPGGWTNGGRWGQTDGRNWRAYSGSWEATIHNWGGGAPDGGWWQTVTDTVANPGSIWVASAWGVSDAGNWGGGVYTCVTIDIKIEFYQSDQSTLVGAVTNSYDPPGETWTYMAVTGTAPANSYYARFVMAAVGQGSSGAFQFDDVSLALIPEPGVAALLGIGGVITLAVRRRRRVA